MNFDYLMKFSRHIDNMYLNENGKIAVYVSALFYDGKGGKGGKSGRANADESFKFVVSVGAELTQSIYDGGSISGENILASYGCKLTIQNNSMDEIQHDTNTTTSPNPVWMSIDIKTIKEEKEESLCSVFDHFDGSNTEEINHEEQNKELGRITVKKDPGIEIEQNYTDIEASPNWLSVEIKKIKEEIEDPPSGVIDIWDGSPHGFEQENVDKGFNQETRKNVPISTFSNTSDENIGDDYLSTKRSLETQKSELTDKKANKCNFCYEYFLESSQFECVLLKLLLLRKKESEKLNLHAAFGIKGSDIRRGGGSSTLLNSTVYYYQ
ncbi:hypothetical protein GQR58_026426 [Nymphon striatum]|nr:hypothetical protein GQR58_026426 [Nymphon striatum]